jgi:hypothetical protein
LKVREGVLLKATIVGKPNPIHEGLAAKVFTFSFSALLDIVASWAPCASQDAFAAGQVTSVEKLL